jgi:hypothetical protein
MVSRGGCGIPSIRAQALQSHAKLRMQAPSLQALYRLQQLLDGSGGVRLAPTTIQVSIQFTLRQSHAELGKLRR